MGQLVDPHRDLRRHKFHIPRFAVVGKARLFHCASFFPCDPLALGSHGSMQAHRMGFPVQCAFSLPYMTCAMKFPMVAAASSCFCRVAWV